MLILSQSSSRGQPARSVTPHCKPTYEEKGKARMSRESEAAYDDNESSLRAFRRRRERDGSDVLDNGFDISYKKTRRTVTREQLERAPECLFTKVLLADGDPSTKGEQTLVLPASDETAGANSWHGSEDLFKVRALSAIASGDNHPLTAVESADKLWVLVPCGRG